MQAGRYLDARICCEQALAVDPDDAGVLHLMGLLCLHGEQFDQAVEWIAQAIRQDPKSIYLWSLGTVLRKQGRNEEALKIFDKAVQLEPANAELWTNLGHVLMELERPADALLSFRHATTLNPDHWAAVNGCGSALHKMDRVEEALNAFERALRLRPDFLPSLKTKAHLLAYLHRFEEVVATYEDIKKLEPDNAETDWNLALVHMLTGNFEAGWAGREARRSVPYFSISHPKTSKPMWLGQEPVEGKTILVYADEGLGDSIQFVRYVPMLVARGARVILVVQKPLLPLLSGIPGVSQCLPTSVGTLPAFDMHCPICSLPMAFGTRLDTIPSTTSYLPGPEADRLRVWEDRLGPRDSLRVGLVWSGNPDHRDDHNRSIPLQALLHLLDVDATFVSLQKDPRPDDKAALRERPGIVDLTADLTDFGETAALVSCLDLVITVDTSVAHLAAALGRPTWILLPYTPDYRWLLDRDDSPWYPSVRLFRQTETRNYAEVIDRVRVELLNLISEGTSTTAIRARQQ
nr:tetratricopeptide repeat-containing glycosyltransferase family protein [Bradyrhizobium sp. dw_411]